MTKIALKTLAGAASALFLLGIHSLAAGTEKLRSEAYFNAISGGNPETITSFYADNAEFHWIGGPLAGVYTGKAQIKAVWERFIKAAGDIDHKVLELTESQKGKLSTVMARVNFIGPAEVPVRFTMVYDNGKIVNEIWEVDKPVIGVARTDVKPEAAAPAEEEAKAEVTPDEPAKTEAKPKEFAKADSITQNAGESGKDSAVILPPEPEKRAGTADAGKDGGTPPLPEQAKSKSASADDEAKASGVKGTPTPLPPSFSNAPAKKSASKPSPAPKKQKDTAKTDGPKKKKAPSEYAQRDDDDDDDYNYNRYSNSHYNDYDRRYYGYYGRPYYYGPSFRLRFGNYGYRNYNRYGYYGYGRY